MADPLARLQSALADRYTIERELGAGGMATVYLAEDLRHHRKVALKVLRPEIAATLGAGRFAREIEVAARLQHPNILPLLDSGEAEGFFFYVMPFVEGESLRDRLARSGEFAIPDAVRILVEVADALSHAHAHGVVHRDIKPDNVLLSGRHALVADFGVAKAVTEATGRQLLTSAGVALGTPAYMAPEQAVADPHQDHRVDIYALGVLGYELLTGRAPFSATTAQEMLAAHVTTDPDPLEQYRPTVSPALAAVVMRCLAKKPADRWQTADEVLTQLEPLATPSGGTTPTQTRPVGALGRLPRWVPWVAGAAAVAVVALVVWRTLPSGGPRWALSNIRQVTREPGIEYMPAISPDGREVAYAAGYPLHMHIYVRDAAGGRALRLTTDSDEHQNLPIWTPDGNRILFMQGRIGETWRAVAVPRMGGVAAPVGRAGMGPVWAVRDDSALYQRSDSLFVGSVDGERESFVTAAPGLHSAAWSPDGSWVAFVRGNGDYIDSRTIANWAPSSIWTVSIHGGTAVRVTPDSGGAFHESPAWLADGRHLLLVSNRGGPRDVYVAHLGAGGRPRGGLLRLTTGLDAHTVSVDRDGRTVAYSRASVRINLYWLPAPATGTVSIRSAIPVTTGNQLVVSGDLSGDGRWLTFDSNVEGTSNIYVMPAGGGEARRLTLSPGEHWSPSFSPDGREIVFYSTRFGTRDVFLINTDGTGETRLTSDPGEEYHPKFSPDGLQVVFAMDRGGRSDLFVVRRDSLGGAWRAPIQVTHGGSDFLGRWSPDGRQLVYASASGVSVRSPDGVERLVVDLERQGRTMLADPTWSPDGRSIWFGAGSPGGEGGIYEVAATGGKERMIVRADDPSRQIVSYSFTVRGGRIFLCMTETESDVYVAELGRR
ncbi:MAG: protein kinase [Gemmatimonadales bacterium]